jgi:cbb3-type cytochrome oxidase subunit 3
MGLSFLLIIIVAGVLYILYRERKKEDAYEEYYENCKDSYVEPMSYKEWLKK